MLYSTYMIVVQTVRPEELLKNDVEVTKLIKVLC